MNSQIQAGWDPRVGQNVGPSPGRLDIFFDIIDYIDIHFIITIYYNLLYLVVLNMCNYFPQDLGWLSDKHDAEPAPPTSSARQTGCASAAAGAPIQ